MPDPDQNPDHGKSLTAGIIAGIVAITALTALGLILRSILAAHR